MWSWTIPFEYLDCSRKIRKFANNFKLFRSLTRREFEVPPIHSWQKITIKRGEKENRFWEFEIDQRTGVLVSDVKGSRKRRPTVVHWYKPGYLILVYTTHDVTRVEEFLWTVSERRKGEGQLHHHSVVVGTNTSIVGSGSLLVSSLPWLRNLLEFSVPTNRRSRPGKVMTDNCFLLYLKIVETR